MNRFVLKPIVAVLSAAVLSACATAYQPVPPFTPVAVDPSGRALKTQNALFILDASSSMDEPAQQFKKFDLAKAVFSNMGQTMPEGVGIQSGLRSFGHDAAVSTKTTILIDEIGTFQRAKLEKALGVIGKDGGISRLDRAIAAAAGDLDGTSGRSALIIVSDGKDMGEAPVAAATALKQKMGGALCIYTIQVGDDPKGKKLLEDVATAGGCGFATHSDNLATGSQMAGFVTQVFIGADLDSDGDGVVDASDKCPGTPAGVKVDAVGCPLDSDGDGVPDYLDKCPGTPAGVKVDAVGCPLDSDGDGVPDYLDKCPGTPAGVKVDAVGCPKSVLDSAKDTWTFNDINFAVNKADILPPSYGILDEIVASLNAHPSLSVAVEGHTDNTGAHDYNMELSKRRAKAVVDYLVGKGISPSRLSSNGYGPDRPVADNATKAGRAKNRRVQFSRVK